MAGGVARHRRRRRSPGRRGARPAQARNDRRRVDRAGSAGPRAGAPMRRGLVAVAGDAGDRTGLGMIAGTRGVFGAAGHGRRDSGPSAARSWRSARSTPPPTYRYACTYRPPYLRLLLDRLRSSAIGCRSARDASRPVSPLQRRPRRAGQGRDSGMDSGVTSLASTERSLPRARSPTAMAEQRGPAAGPGASRSPAARG